MKRIDNAASFIGIMYFMMLEVMGWPPKKMTINNLSKFFGIPENTIIAFGKSGIIPTTILSVIKSLKKEKGIKKTSLNRLINDWRLQEILKQVDVINLDLMSIRRDSENNSSKISDISGIYKLLDAITEESIGSRDKPKPTNEGQENLVPETRDPIKSNGTTNQDLPDEVASALEGIDYNDSENKVVEALQKALPGYVIAIEGAALFIYHNETEECFVVE